MKKSFTVILMLLMVFIFHSLPIEGETDGVSGATKKWREPPYGYTYKVSIAMGVEGYFLQYSDNLFRGRGFNAKGAERLKDFGIKTVLTIAPDKAMAEAAKAAGLKVITLQWKGQKVMPAEDLQQFLKVLKENPGPYYLHSQEKLQRAGALVAIYRIYIEKWPYEKTIIEYARVGGSLKDDDRLLRGIKKR